jgi:hypothetical protein
MAWRLRFTAAACGLAAWLAMSNAAGAATITYDLTADVDAGYTCCGWVDTTFIYLVDPNTGTYELPEYTLSVGDAIDLSVTFSRSVTLSDFFIGLQYADASAHIHGNPTFAYFNGGFAVTPPPGWNENSASFGALGFSAGFEPVIGAFSFDKIIVNAVIASMNDGSGTVSSMLVGQYQAAIAMNHYSDVTATPIPAALPLFATALGGMAFAGWRRRKAAA